MQIKKRKRKQIRLQLRIYHIIKSIHIHYNVDDYGL